MNFKKLPNLICLSDFYVLLGHNGAQLVGEMACSLQTSARSTPNEDNSQNPSKLKLQLFPIDEFTQKDLEMVNLKGILNTGVHFY